MKISLDDIITRLERTRSPDRAVDFSLARVVGWKVLSVPGDGGKRKDLWIVPGSDEPDKVPKYTSSLDAAKQFADQLLPNNAVAVTFGDEIEAIAEGGERVRSRVGAVAICLAALSAYQEAMRKV
ncbi:hypothetical protein NCHU2750_01780 [Neorhizobium sp. NCHU2750]|nr:hypothetical protein NCHU2750_01780 [Neorhizobium sp. NCHU2750]